MCSKVWKGMKKGHAVFSKGTRWIPGRESNLNLWFDSWSSLGPLREMVQGPLLVEEANLKIKDVITPQGWDWSKVSLNLPNHIKLDIQAIPFVVTLMSEDRIVWAANSHGSFDLKNAYKLAIAKENPPAFSSQ